MGYPCRVHYDTRLAGAENLNSVLPESWARIENIPFYSYSLPLQPFKAPAEQLCEWRTQVETGAPPLQPTKVADPRSYFILKTARSGSTFFHNVFRRILLNSNTTIETIVFEPFSRKECFTKKAKHRARPFEATPVVTKGLTRLLNDTYRCNVPKERTRSIASRCNPAKFCHKKEKFNLHSPTSSLVSINPRWAMNANFSNLGLSTNTAAVINVRRTNLVRQAYSKHKHGGGPGDGIACPKNLVNAKNRAPFDQRSALCIIWHYAIGDQEFASHVALQSAAAVGKAPYLVLYEDLLAHGPVVKSALFHDHLGLPGKPEENNKHRQKHTATHMCDYSDVPCEDGTLSWLAGFPCLKKQFHADPNQAWTMPMLPNGSISLFGDCQPLAILDTVNVRLMDELYAS